MGNVLPDRFFWALPPEEEGAEGQLMEPPAEIAPGGGNDNSKGGSRRVH